MRRDLSFWLATFVVVNMMIGTGIFKTPATVARLAGSLPVAVTMWIVGAIIALAGALSLGELAAAIPRTGGVYEFLRRAYGPTTAFIFGWTRLVLLMPSAIGSFAKLGAEAFSSLIGLAPNGERDARIAVVFIAACTGANLLRVKSSAAGQGALTAVKYAGVLALAGVGLVAPVLPSAAPTPVPTLPFHEMPTALGCFAALVAVMWPYDGWADLAMLAGEVRQPGRTLPRALLVGTLGVGIVYVAANIGYARVLGIEGLRAATATDIAGLQLATRTLGAAGTSVLSALIVVSCIGGCMSNLLTNPRIFVAMATDGLAPRWLGEVSSRTGAPIRGVLAGGALGIVYVLFQSFEQLTAGFVVGAFPFYILATAAVIVLRRREPSLPRPFLVPAYPLLPIVFIVGASLLLVGAATAIDGTAIFAFAVVAAGLPVRKLFARIYPAS